MYCDLGPHVQPPPFFDIAQSPVSSDHGTASLEPALSLSLWPPCYDNGAVCGGPYVHDNASPPASFILQTSTSTSASDVLPGCLLSTLCPQLLPSLSFCLRVLHVSLYVLYKPTADVELRLQTFLSFLATLHILNYTEITVGATSRGEMLDHRRARRSGRPDWRWCAQGCYSY